MARSVDKRLVVVLVVAAALLVWFIRGLHWAELADALYGVKVGYLVLAAGLMLGDYFSRAVRWMLIVRHVDREVPLSTLWQATAIGAALNTFLPLRGGDLVRPAVVAQDRGAPFTTLLSTTVVERLFDAFGVVMALVLILLLLSSQTGDPATLAQLRRWGIGSGVLAVVGFGVVLFLATRQARATLMRVLRPWPAPVRMRMMRSYLQLAHGLEAAGNPLRLLPALLTTVVLWSFTTSAILATLYALGVQASLALGLFIAVALTASISVPQAPGYLGLFQVVMENAAMLWGVPEAVAEAESFVLWFVYVGPITLAGLWYAFRGRRGFFRFRRELLAGSEKDA
ncbi:MAG: flippase-like domain-containing protein [Deltaproteobacteria bacterium]|nr:flippase-like domain-containing protein [Deltaproteobacteria bacterium]